MPVHDWTAVRAGKFHHFHTAWIMQLADYLNGGSLPAGYSAYAENRAAVYQPDLLTLTANPPPTPQTDGGVAILPVVERRAVAASRPLPGRFLAIRNVDGDRIVAGIEIVSPSNKDRTLHVGAFAGKVRDFLAIGVHMVVIDVLPPGRHDPGGMHPAVWEGIAGDATPDAAPADRPLTFVGYQAADLPVAHLSYSAVGRPIPTVPLFLDDDAFINLPLEETYTFAHARLPADLRAVLG